MNNRTIYDAVCIETSRNTTRSFSTSFSLGVRMLDKRFRDPIHAIYGFVRFADEIVDTFHEAPQKELLDRFRSDMELAIDQGISLNPILHSFQSVVRGSGIERGLIDTFLDSMEMDLSRTRHDQGSFQQYILGSAEVVGLMCLRVFCEGDKALFEHLKPHAMSLGAAFQKVNFLRDLRQDNQDLGRTYFPGTDLNALSAEQKQRIEDDIRADLDHAVIGIRQLPKGARVGVHLAYLYYLRLFKNIRSTPVSELMTRRIQVRKRSKLRLLVGAVVQHKLDLV
ncbi:MAG TPA: phytoene/squalene synthase family protein [Flavobacteriales bacterium]|nr:phytoene/squalene synthase family protein [Flavobacteriales bacterium]MBP6643058.1 phytoene/squalene synthase family protein [Flavobacteriales bacterium]HQV74140.1 phytoene/squalene synthase family protein [Flavobacteriales bacterium]HQW39732.1 phytoene/squalene synthase family protein [Flavobacteriales bacterium]